jgi:anti-anti-sigma factor
MSSVRTEVKGDTLLLVVEGIFDIELYNEFNNSYKEHVGVVSRFIIDFAGTDRIDSAALGLMLLMRQKIGGDGDRIQLINANDKVRRSLDTAQFSKLFDLQ